MVDILGTADQDSDMGRTVGSTAGNIAGKPRFVDECLVKHYLLCFPEVKTCLVILIHFEDSPLQELALLSPTQEFQEVSFHLLIWMSGCFHDCY